MKKILLVVCIVITGGFITRQAHAQTRLGYGFRGAVNFSNLNDTNVNTSSHTGLMLGLYFDVPVVNKLFYIQPEALYTQKGFEQNGNTYRIDYVEVPLLARVNFVNPTHLTPFVYAGPYFGFKVNTDYPQRIVYDDKPPAGDIPITNGDNIKTTDVGVTVGGGLDFGHIDIGVRYDAGLTNISDANNIDAKNGVFSIVAGLGF